MNRAVPADSWLASRHHNHNVVALRTTHSHLNPSSSLSTLCHLTVFDRTAPDRSAFESEARPLCACVLTRLYQAAARRPVITPLAATPRTGPERTGAQAFRTESTEVLSVHSILVARPLSGQVPGRPTVAAVIRRPPLRLAGHLGGRGSLRPRLVTRCGGRSGNWNTDNTMATTNKTWMSAPIRRAVTFSAVRPRGTR